MTITAQQLEARRSKIGSSDAAAILGVDPYRTAYDVWLEKTGRHTPEIGNKKTWLGDQCEQVCRQAVSEYLGRPVVQATGTVVSRVCDRLAANLDGAVERFAKGCEIVEAKSGWHGGSSQWGDAGTDRIPGHVQVQVHHQLLCNESDIAYVARLFGTYGGGLDAAVYEVYADSELTRLLVEKLPAFWDKYVATDTPPPITEPISNQTEDYFGSLTRSPVVCNLDDDLVAQFAEVKARKKAAEDEERRIRKMILAMAGEADTVQDAAGFSLKIATYPGRTTIDRDRLRSEYPEVHEQVQVIGDPYPVLRVQKKKEVDA